LISSSSSRLGSSTSAIGVSFPFYLGSGAHRTVQGQIFEQGAAAQHIISSFRRISNAGLFQNEICIFVKPSMTTEFRKKCLKKII
jgi:hypothetical protein